MLGDYEPVATLAVTDLARAAEFYEQVLGCKPIDGFPGGRFYTAGTGVLQIYESQYAGTNQATALSFRVPKDAFDDEVAALRAAGVTFETFDAPQTTWQDGIATMDDIRAAWFKDPDGNFIAFEEKPQA